MSSKDQGPALLSGSPDSLSLTKEHVGRGQTGRNLELAMACWYPSQYSSQHPTCWGACGGLHLRL